MRAISHPLQHESKESCSNAAVEAGFDFTPEDWPLLLEGQLNKGNVKIKEGDCIS